MNRRAEEELLQRIRRMKRQAVAFQRRVEEFLASLPEIADEEFEPPVSPEADLVGALECLVMDVLQPARQKLTELEGLLQEDPAAGSR